VKGGGPVVAPDAPATGVVIITVHVQLQRPLGAGSRERSGVGTPPAPLYQLTLHRVTIWL
jgi:hypothetical protein